MTDAPAPWEIPRTALQAIREARQVTVRIVGRDTAVQLTISKSEARALLLEGARAHGRSEFDVAWYPRGRIAAIFACGHVAAPAHRHFTIRQ